MLGDFSFPVNRRPQRFASGLFRRDRERLFQVVPDLNPYAGFRTAMMVGRANYCCSTRLNHALKESQSAKQIEMFENRERDELARLASWASSTTAYLQRSVTP